MIALTETPKAPVLGVPVNALTMDDAVALADSAIQDRRRLLIGVVNAAKLVNMRRDRRLRQAVLASDVILPDGMSVVWAARLLRRPLPERVTGVDLLTRLLEHAHQKRYGVYCLGATDEVLAEVLDRIREEYPGARVVGHRNGYFSADEEPAVAEHIAASRPDMLFAAMSSPKKEMFLARWAGEINVPVCHGVGGAFDVLAGKVQRAPGIWQRLGLEWLYRVAQEPRRLWRRYLVTNTLFTCLVLWERMLGSPPVEASGG